MPSYQALSKTQHAGQHYQAPSNYRFAAQDTTVPLGHSELRRACMHMPTAFILQHAAFQLIAIQGFLPGKNLWIDAHGNWLGGYLPDTYQGYPFALLPTQANGQRVLCIDTDSGCFTPHIGQPLFDASGTPSASVSAMLSLWQHITQQRSSAHQLSQQLAQHQLLQPWPIQLQTDTGPHTLQGLYRVNETALQQLDAQPLQTLQRTGALAMAYMQLLSMQHLRTLAQHARQHAAAPSPATTASTANLDLEFLQHNSTLRFADL